MATIFTTIMPAASAMAIARLAQYVVNKTSYGVNEAGMIVNKIT